ncbi:MAG: secretin N-terminal domain-containing protein [Candidatus Babeliales bacterium]
MKKLFKKIIFIFCFFILITTPSFNMGMPMPTTPSQTLKQATAPTAMPTPTQITTASIPAQTIPISGVTSPATEQPTTTLAPEKFIAKIEDKDQNIVMGLSLEDAEISVDQEKKLAEKTKESAKSESKEKFEKKPSTKDSDKQDKQAEKKDIYLNFENAELSNLVNYIAEIKKINLIPDAALANKKVSLTVRKPLSIDGAWNIFLTVLEMGGFSITPRGNVQVVVPNNLAEKQPIPAYINVAYETLPDSDEVIRYVVFFQNITTAAIQNLLQSMLSANGKIQPYNDINGLVITDRSYNIKSAMRVVQELDQTGLQETVVVMRLKRTNALDVKRLLESLIYKDQVPQNPLARLLGRQAESTLTYFSPGTKIIDEPRTNSLILLGNQKSIEKIEKFITENIDTELKGTETPLHIYELQNINAASIKTILTETVNSQAEAAKQGGIRGGVKYFKPMTFEVDTEGNRLLVSCTEKQDWKMLKKTIKDLDKPQPQVAVEALIVSVNFNDTKFLGGGIRNKHADQIGKGVNFQSPMPNGSTIFNPPQTGTDPGTSIELANLAAGLVGGIGTTILTLGSTANLWGILEILQQQTNTSILSQPFFTVANNAQATITVGQTVYITTEKTQSGFTGQKAESAPTTLKVTPQINLDGIIRLNIELDFTEFTDPEKGNKDTRKLKTDVSLANGQVLALGGFVQTRTEEAVSKTPVLGDIPILGWFFKNKTKQITKNYLLIFMSPTIIKPRSTPGTNLYTKMKLEDATKSVKEAVQYEKTNDPINNWFFKPKKDDYSHKIGDYACAKYQPTVVDIKNDPYFRALPEKEEKYWKKIERQKKEKTELAEKSKKGAILKEKTSDISLEAKRKQLKDLIAKNPIIKTENTKNDKTIILERDNFKKILEEPKENKNLTKKLKSRSLA